MNSLEKRETFFKSDFKSRENGEQKIIEGYFIVYNQEIELWRDFYEEINFGACTESIAKNDIRALFNHRSEIVLGRNTIGTLVLREDNHGIFGSITINCSDTEALNIYERVKRGDISGCSFGFYPTEERYVDRSDGGKKCIVEKADILEVSICTFPAYPQTQIEARQKDFNASTKVIDLENRKKDLKERKKLWE